MSVVYCHYCDKQIDTDFHAEHFDDDLNCEIEKETKEQYLNSVREFEAEKEYREKNTGWSV